MKKPRKDPAAVALGRKGGRAIAKRGSEYFAELARRNRNPGRKRLPDDQVKPASLARRRIRAAGRPAQTEVIEKAPAHRPRMAKELASKGGTARAASLTPQERRQIAKRAAKRRWNRP